MHLVADGSDSPESPCASGRHLCGERHPGAEGYEPKDAHGRQQEVRRHGTPNPADSPCYLVLTLLDVTCAARHHAALHVPATRKPVARMHRHRVETACRVLSRHCVSEERHVLRPLRSHRGKRASPGCRWSSRRPSYRLSAPFSDARASRNACRKSDAAIISTLPRCLRSSNPFSRNMRFASRDENRSSQKS